VPDAEMADPVCVARVIEELAIVQPKIVVVMGEEALVVLNELEIPLRRDVEPAIGEIQTLTPQIDALYVPNIDEALDDESAKREFWGAFRTLGQWWDELPPY
jgi:uracil-DNA glycosylase